MMRAILSKVMWLMRGMLWLGRSTATVLGLAVMLALVVGLASTALAANGQPFLLGKLTNAATATTRLVGNVAAGPALQVINPNTAASARGLDVLVASGKPPIYVSPSAGKAINLNADKVDSKDASQLEGALAYAHINVDGTLDTALSKNVDKSLRVETGSYCVNSTVPPRNAVATIDQFSSFGFIELHTDGGGTQCSAVGGTYNIQVHIANSAGTASADKAFYIVIN
jgi:hypothetical protein